MLKLGRYWPWKTVLRHFHVPVRPMLLHRMALVSFRLFCKNLGNLQEFFGQVGYRPPWPKIARTPMVLNVLTDPWHFQVRERIRAGSNRYIKLRLWDVFRRDKLKHTCIPFIYFELFRIIEAYSIVLRCFYCKNPLRVFPTAWGVFPSIHLLNEKDRTTYFSAARQVKILKCPCDPQGRCCICPRDW